MSSRDPRARGALTPPTEISTLCLLSGVWLGMVLLANPLGDFPLNDDWAYGRAVYDLVENRQFQLSGWTATNLLSQVLWGALFSLPAGFSFTALRLSSLVLGLVGVLTAYLLLKRASGNRELAVLGALLVAANPLYFALSNTFMNDVPFFGFALPAVYFFWRALERDSQRSIFWGTVFSVMAVLARQVGIVIPAAFAIAYFVARGPGWGALIRAITPVIIGIAAQLAYVTWLVLTARMPENYGNQFRTLFDEVARGPAHLLSNVTAVTSLSLIYLGLFSFPFLLFVLLATWRSLSRSGRHQLLLTSFVLASGLFLLRFLPYGPIPARGHVFDDLGIGPVILKNSSLPAGPPVLWIIATLIGACGAALALQFLWSTARRCFVMRGRGEVSPVLFALLLGAGYFLPLAPLGFGAFGFYDRYLIPLLPLGLVCAAAATGEVRTVLKSSQSVAFASVAVLLGVMFTASVTRDYLSWNRVRWQALSDLVHRQQIPPARIDGGFEFNGWYLYHDGYEYDPTFTRSWYWVDDDEYVVTFNSIDGYEEITRYSFRRWLPRGVGELRVLRRDPLEPLRTARDCEPHCALPVSGSM